MELCLDHLELMNAVLDGEATPAQTRELEGHLAICPACAALFSDLTALHAGADALVTSAPEGFALRVMTAVVAPTKTGRPVRQWRTLAAMAAVCAVALLGSGALRYFQQGQDLPAPADAAPTQVVEANQIITAGLPPEDVPEVQKADGGEAPLPVLAPPVTAPPVTAPPVTTPPPSAQPSDTTPMVRSALMGVAPSPSASLPPEAGQAIAPSCNTPVPPTADATPSPEPPPSVGPVQFSGQMSNSDHLPTAITPDEALALVVERTHGESGYTLITTPAETETATCSLQLLDGETVILDSVIRYTGLSPNEQYHCFTLEIDGDTTDYAVPLDGSAVLWEGDVADEGKSFRAALAQTE